MEITHRHPRKDVPTLNASRSYQWEDWRAIGPLDHFSLRVEACHLTASSGFVSQNVQILIFGAGLQKGGGSVKCETPEWNWPGVITAILT